MRQPDNHFTLLTTAFHSSIATVGKAMCSREEVSYPILKKHDVDYVLIIFGGLIGFSGDDINKYLWMIRIAEGVWPDEVKESNYFTPRGEYKVDSDATPTMRESLMYKMSYYRELFFLCLSLDVAWLGFPCASDGVKRGGEVGDPAREVKMELTFPSFYLLVTGFNELFGGQKATVSFLRPPHHSLFQFFLRNTC